MVRLQKPSDNQYQITIPITKIRKLGWEDADGKELDVSLTPDMDGVIIREV